MGSKKGRAPASWRSPEGWLLKGIIGVYYRMGYHKPHIIADCLRKHVSQEDIETIVGKVTDVAIQQRGHKGQFGPNRFEWPTQHALGMKMWPLANKIVNEKRKLTLQEIHEIAATGVATFEKEGPTPITIVAAVSGGTAGFVYFNITDSYRCNFGYTNQSDAQKRIKAFKKGDIDGKMRLWHILYCENARELEGLLKTKHHDDHLGNEIYDLMADQAYLNAQKLAAIHGISFRPVMAYGRILREEPTVGDSAGSPGDRENNLSA